MNHKIMYNDVDLQSENVFRVVDEKYFRMYKPPRYESVVFKTNQWILYELFNGNQFITTIPIVEKGKNITEDFMSWYLGPLTKEGLIDDLTYLILRNIIAAVGIVYSKEHWCVAFGKPTGKEKRYAVSIGGWAIGKITAEETTLDQILEAEIQQGFISQQVGDPTYKFGYTHLLRAHAKFKLFGWSRRVLLNWNKYNVIATSRGQGKSYLAAFIVARELFNPTPGYGGRPFRDIKYFVPDKANVGEQVMRYIENLLGDLKTKKWNGQPIITIDKAKYIIKCNITGNTFQMVSLHNYGKNKWDLGSAQGEGIASDVAIIDEAARIPDDFWVSFHQRAVFETQNFFLISTINEETPRDHWFYRLLIDGESGDKRISSHRVTIDENELMRQWLSDEEYQIVLASAKKSLKEKGDKEFYSKGYCVVLEESNVFDVNQYITNPNREKYSERDFRILWFDLGKLTDTCGLVLINLKHQEIEEVKIVVNSKYGTQLEYAKEYKKRFPNLLIIWDRTGVGEAVSEQDTEWIVDCWIKSTGAGELNYNRSHHYWTCNKGKIITTAATVLNNRLIKIPGDVVDLIEQLQNFVKMKSGRWEVILYKGKGKKKDDLVLSMCYAVIYFYLILGLKSQTDIEEYAKESWFWEIVSYDTIDDSNYSYHNWLY